MDSGDVEQLTSALQGNANRLLAGPISDSDIEPRFDAICAGLVAVVPGAKWAAVTVAVGRGLECHGATDERIPTLAKVMAECGHGPCIDAIAVGTTEEILVNDLAEVTQRWPVFAPAAVDAGMASVLCHAMAPDDQPAGSITVWSDQVGAFADPMAGTIMAAFATQAAIAVYGAKRALHLTRALASRDLIGRAKGILMERFGLSDEDAFRLLVRSSQDVNMKLHDVAEYLCQEPIARGGRPGQHV